MIICQYTGSGLSHILAFNKHGVLIISLLILQFHVKVLCRKTCQRVSDGPLSIDRVTDEH